MIRSWEYKSEIQSKLTLLATLVAVLRHLVFKCWGTFGIKLFHLMQMICGVKKGPSRPQLT